MAYKTDGLILPCMEHSLLTLEDLASAAGLPSELVEKFVDEGVIEPTANTGPDLLFSASAIVRLERIMRLGHDLDVNLAGIAVILDMRDRIEDLQRELAGLRTRLGVKV